MTKEKLMEWGLTEEQANKVMEGLNGSFVTKARFNEVNTELTKAKTTITERDGQLEALKKSGADATALQEQITQLQADNKKKDADHAAELKALKISNVELALTGAKAKNTVAVKALLADVIAKAELAEDGTVKGLDDEVKKLVEGKDTAFLFDKATEKKFKGAKSAEKGDGGGDGSMTLEKFRGLSPAERYDFSVNHPDEYKNLYGGNE